MFSINYDQRDLMFQKDETKPHQCGTGVGAGESSSYHLILMQCGVVQRPWLSVECKEEPILSGSADKSHLTRSLLVRDSRSLPRPRAFRSEDSNEPRH